MSCLNDEKRTLSRRDALKTLVAATGAIALTNLPEQWDTPVIEAGVIPAHAQASAAPIGTLAISNLTEVFTGVNDCTTSQGAGSTSIVTMNYNDPSGGVVNGTVVNEVFTLLPSGSGGSGTFTSLTITGDGFTGTISYEPCTTFGGNTSIQIDVSITTPDGRTSNTITTAADAPPGAAATGGVGARTA